MKSLSPQVVSAAKLPILNPSEFDLWKMRIEQYFLMTYYSLWEVILNGDSPAPTRVIEGFVQPVPLTTAEQRLARKNELKAHGTLLIALPDKHQLKFNIHKDAKTLKEAIEKMFGGNKEIKKVHKTLIKQQYKNFTGSSSESLNQIHDRLQFLISQIEILGESLSQKDINLNLKIYEAEVKSSSSASTSTQNIAFVSSSNTDNTTEPVSAAASVYAVSAKNSVSALPNVDTLSNAVIYSFFASQSTSPQLDNDDLKQIDADDLEEMDLKWQMGMLTVECYNYHRKRHFARECRSPKDTRRNGVDEPQRRNVPVETSTSNALVSQCDGVCSYNWSFQAEEEPTNYALMAFTSSSSSSSDNELRDNALVVLRQKFEKAEQKRDDLKLNDESLPPSPVYDRYQSGDSPTKPDNDLSHTHKPSASIIEDWVSDSEDDSEAELSQNALSFVQPTEQVKSPRPSVNLVETSIPAANPMTVIPNPKSNDTRRNKRHVLFRGNHQQYARMALLNPQKHVVPTAILTQSKLVPITAARPVTAAIPKSVVTKPHSPPRRHINHSPSPKASNFLPKVTAVKVPQGNPQHALKDKGVIDSGCSRHMTGNMSYLSDFEELNSGYVAFCGNPKGGKISRKGIENQLSLKVKIIISDNGTELKNNDLNQFCGMNEIKREFSVPRTPQQNGIAERKNITLIEAARTMLADSLLPIPFWAEAVNTSCYVKNRVLVTKPQNKTPYKLLHGRTPSTDFMRPFGCPVTILNTLDPLGKFDGKVDEEFLVGYCVSGKAFRVFNNRTRIVQETLHINFLENKPSVADSGPTWLFDIDTLIKTMNYQPVTAGNQSNPSTGSFSSNNPQNTDGDDAFETTKHDDKTKREAKVKSPVESSRGYRNLSAEFEDFSDNIINEINAADSPVPAVGQIFTNNTNIFSAAGPSNVVVSPTHGKSSYMDTSQLPYDPNMPELEDITYSDDEEDVGAEANFTNLETTITVSPIPITRVHKDHHVTQIIGDLSSATQTRSMSRVAQDQGELSQINNDNFHTCMFACFLSQKEPKRVHQALKDPNWIEAMQEELLQFKMQKVWVLVDLPREKRVIGFEDLDYPDKVYKVAKALYGLHQAPRAWYETLANYLLENGFQKGKIDQTLFIKSQDKYVAEILRKFGLTDGKLASTPIDTKKPLLKDPDGEDVDVHTYRSMIGSLMYLTSSRPNIMFAVYACAHFQMTHKASHLHAVKRIFRYLKGKPYLGLWYPKDSPFNLVAYSE
nr:putative ribonuclease H-like domain-containing protein [Tanacetum cinerariifolium]